MAEQPHYPKGHEVGMRVPEGGSSCAKCEYLRKDGESCENRYFIEWNGSKKLPAPADEYCCDFFEPNPEKSSLGEYRKFRELEKPLFDAEMMAHRSSIEKEYES